MLTSTIDSILSFLYLLMGITSATAIVIFFIAKDKDDVAKSKLKKTAKWVFLAPIVIYLPIFLIPFVYAVIYGIPLK